jgi:hypothetical protein
VDGQADWCISILDYINACLILHSDTSITSGITMLRPFRRTAFAEASYL